MVAFNIYIRLNGRKIKISDLVFLCSFGRLFFYRLYAGRTFSMCKISGFVFLWSFHILFLLEGQFSMVFCIIKCVVVYMFADCKLHSHLIKKQINNWWKSSGINIILFDEACCWLFQQIFSWETIERFVAILLCISIKHIHRIYIMFYLKNF
jgi:hypothetical protein